MKTITCDADRVGRYVAERLGVQGWSAPAGIGLERDGKLIGGVVYDYFNGASICMHVASDGGNWLTREFLWFAFYYPFVQLGVKRITGLVPESNLAARRFDEHLGFILEARMKDAHPTGDVLVYRMLKSECRYLERPNVQTRRACYA